MKINELRAYVDFLIISYSENINKIDPEKQLEVKIEEENNYYMIGIVWICEIRKNDECILADDWFKLLKSEKKVHLKKYINESLNTVTLQKIIKW